MMVFLLEKIELKWKSNWYVLDVFMVYNRHLVEKKLNLYFQMLGANTTFDVG